MEQQEERVLSKNGNFLLARMLTALGIFTSLCMYIMNVSAWEIDL